MRSADMVMSFYAGMYTSTDLRRVHHFRKYSKCSIQRSFHFIKARVRIWKRAGWYLVFLELIINCILMNTLAVILENSFRESKDQFEAASELHHMTRKHFRFGFFNFKLMLARWRTPPITDRETFGERARWKIQCQNEVRQQKRKFTKVGKNKKERIQRFTPRKRWRLILTAALSKMFLTPKSLPFL